MVRKLTFLEIREQHGLNTVELSNKARVEPDVVYFMLRGYPVLKEDAVHVIDATSQIVGFKYHLHDIDIQLSGEGE